MCCMPVNERNVAAISHSDRNIYYGDNIYNDGKNDIDGKANKMIILGTKMTVM